jgi:NADH dehydrogenase FAD-containing subunit
MADRKDHRVVIAGAGFAGFNAARELLRLAGTTTEIVVINSTDYFLYLPLMPQVTGGLIEPRHIRVSLPGRLRKTRFVLGTVHHVDPARKEVSWLGPEDTSGSVRYDRLILTAGSVDRGRLVVDEFMAVPGVPDVYACGDCAAVPDLTRPGQVCGMTAQHAQRRGRQVARNVAASLGHGTARPYKRRDLGFLLDL